MIIIIPLGGIGNRFKKSGYQRPKALINVYGKPILYYLLDALNIINKIDYIYIPYNNEYSNYNFESMLRKDYKEYKFKFLKLSHNTRGAVETINMAINNLNIIDDTSVICMDSDNFYSCDIITKWGGDNCVFSVEDKGSKPIYSYVSLNDEGYIIDIKEKDKISDFACTGAYGFKSIKQLLKYTTKIIKCNMTQHSEYYTSGVIKEMINDGIIFTNKQIDKRFFTCLGTPLQLKQYYNNHPKISCINGKNMTQSKRICFDLDNTLVSYPTIPGDYTTVKPIEKNISLLRYIKKLGNTIIIYTARRMKTHNGNIGKVNNDIGKITYDTLKKFNIPYDEIYFGKPYADFYIDDLAVNCFHNIEKELGYYKNNIEPRDFNTIENVSIETIVKQGNDLSGEIYYYQNIPLEVKDMFPLFINHTDDVSYQIEKIYGMTLSDMYISEILTYDTLKHIMNSIIRLQGVDIVEDDINIYDNYVNKISKRWIQYDYSKFKNSENTYNDLINSLTIYQENKSGKQTVIHGDPVFTNILINTYEKIKFIDMRGKMGNKLTIQGDWLYDWAKLYQSLIGYDAILMSIEMSNNYKSEMISYFKDYFIDNYSKEDFDNLKIITKGLLFSLIPLHDNNKCDDYYNLIFSKFLN